MLLIFLSSYSVTENLVRLLKFALFYSHNPLIQLLLKGFSNSCLNFKLLVPLGVSVIVVKRVPELSW